MRVSLFRRFTFEAAHCNRSAPPGTKQARLHGHSYEVTVYVAGTVDSQSGWLVDFGDIKADSYSLIDRLDHRILNEVDGMTDSSCADVQRWLDTRLHESQAGFDRCKVCVKGDTAFSPVFKSAAAPPAGLVKVVFGFAAAHFLPRLPSTHKCRRMHGHSFRVSVSSRDADTAVAAVAALYPQLDHRVLNEVPGLENPTSEQLAHWLWKRLHEGEGSTEEIIVQETCTTGCIYRGED